MVHLLNGDLSDAEMDLLAGSQTGISAIVLWELAKLKQLGRIAFGPDDTRVSIFLSQCQIWKVDSAIAVASTLLDFQSDPADELIAATSVINQVPLLTRDNKIRASKMVPLALV